MSTRSLNRVELIGNLTRDVELRYTSSGTPVASFTIATNRNYTDSSGNNVETAEFTPIVAWAKLAEICAQFLKKGTKTYVDGRLQTNSWQDKETGKTMRRTEVVATNMIVLFNGGPSEQVSEQSVDSASDFSEVGEPVDMKDLAGTDFVDLGTDDQSDDDKKKKDDGDSDDSSETPF